MKFTPKTETQIIDERLLPKGEYDFECVHAEDKVSKKAAARGETEFDMIHVGLKVYRPDGNGFVLVDDYLLDAMLYKLLHFCAAGGLTANYEAGTLTADACVGVCGRVKLKREEQDGFEPKNAVQDYCKPKDGEDAKPKAAPRHIEQPVPDDMDIPF